MEPYLAAVAPYRTPIYYCFASGRFFFNCVSSLVDTVTGLCLEKYCGLHPRTKTPISLGPMLKGSGQLSSQIAGTRFSLPVTGDLCKSLPFCILASSLAIFRTSGVAKGQWAGAPQL